MSENKQLPVITISRQYGAGGHSVAKALAGRLGLEYYDYDFVRLTAKVSGYTEDEIKKEGEDLTGGAKFVNSFLTTGSFSNPYHEIFQAEKAVILGLAQKPCILVGRCSNMILRAEGIRTLDVFLSASLDFRLKRAAELKENGNVDLEKYLERRDHWRDTYYRAYTGHELGKAEDYHLCLDVSRFGVEYCADLIAELARL